jgi:hypothetical protein
MIQIRSGLIGPDGKYHNNPSKKKGEVVMPRNPRPDRALSRRSNVEQISDAEVVRLAGFELGTLVPETDALVQLSYRRTN